MHTMLIQAAAEAGANHMTVGRVFADIPHDAAAIVVYVLSAVSVGWVVIAGRRKHDQKTGSE